MQIRKATIQDIDLLVTLRLDFLQDVRGHALQDAQKLVGMLREYYQTHLPGGDFIVLLAEQDGEVAATAFLSLHAYPPTDQVMAPRRGYISNVFTYPAHRGKGCARLLMERLVALCREEGAGEAQLVATPAGRPLYEALGFAPHSGATAMHLAL